MQLTSAQIRCLLALLSLSRMQEAVASKDIAKLLGVTRPSVHKLLSALMRDGWLEKEYYGAARLTPAGEALAQSLEARSERLVLLFSRSLGLPLDESSTAASLLMAGLREDSLIKLESAAEMKP